MLPSTSSSSSSPLAIVPNCQFVLPTTETSQLFHALGHLNPPTTESQLLPLQALEEFPDSGTESDDEGGGEAEDDEEVADAAAGSMDLSSDSLHQRPSSTPVGAMRALDLDSNGHAERDNKENVQPAAAIYQQHMEQMFPPLMLTDPNDGNHSSEEELEEINKTNNNNRSSNNSNTSPSTAVNSSSSSSSASSSSQRNTAVTPMMMSNVDENMAVATTNSGGGGGSAMLAVPGANADQDMQDPVEFSTSPPTDVHKPRRSLSPPPNFFPAASGSASAVAAAAPNLLSPIAHAQVGAGAFEAPAALSSTGAVTRSASRRTISPRKRYRQSRTQHLMAHRPCLDFEKMQQLKARAVTSWRHGGELSLFCW